MKVPLIVKAKDNELEIYTNSKKIVAPLPFKPFALCETERFPNIQGPIEQWTKYPDHKELAYTKMSFSSISEHRDFIQRNQLMGRFIYHNSYHQQMFISKPDLLLEYGNTQPLKIMYWDIETVTRGDGNFPTPDAYPVLCIGWSVWSYANDGTRDLVARGQCNDYQDDDNIQDTRVLKEFVNIVGQFDPDVIAGYNSEMFDFPFFYTRCKIKKVDMTKVNRGSDKEPWISPEGNIYITGRIHYDMFKKVFKDQSLYDLNSKGLKVVARHYSVPLTSEQDIELNDAIKNTIKVWREDKQLMLDYLDADIIRTEHLGHIYTRNDIMLADKMHVPLENTMNGFPSFIPKIICGRQNVKAKLISTESNFSKYNSLTGSYFKLNKCRGKELRFQGALVGIYKKGWFPYVDKIDFTSMYPSAIVTWNLGPDTTKLMAVEKYTGKYKFSRDEKYNWLRIPDENFQADLIIRIRHDKDGYLKKYIKELWAERAIIKAEMKKAKAADEMDRLAGLDSQQLAIKVILNSIFGFMGLRPSKYGEFATAATITGMCRWTTLKTIQKYEDILVELDTDGLVVNDKVDEKATNDWLTELMLTTFNINDNYMAMELDRIGPAYFCSKKNYVTLEDGKIKIHGSSLKSSRMTAVQTKTRDLAIESVFYGKPKEEVINEAFDFSKNKLEDFQERVRLAKDVEGYSDLTGQIPFLSKQVEVVSGKAPDVKDLITFYITKNQVAGDEYKVFYEGKKTKGKNYTIENLVKSKDELDVSHYNQMIAKMLALFDIEKDEQVDLFANDDSVAKISKRKSKLDTVPWDN